MVQHNNMTSNKDKNKPLNEEIDQTDRVSKLGRENGLFKQCMDEIKHSHTIGLKLRTAAVAAGALSDVQNYAEILSLFYVATRAMEMRMDEILEGDSGSIDNFTEKQFVLLKDVRSLGYSFCKGYELDLEFLLGQNWKFKVDEMTTEPAKKYVERLKVGNEIELVAAAFILWGPLVIGGGAVMKPRVRKTFGEGATNVFEDVVGDVNGGRSQRRRKFIDVYDGLLDEEKDDAKKKEMFESIVNVCGQFMSMNNEMMLSVKRYPWWSKYVWAVIFTVLAIIASLLLRK